MNFEVWSEEQEGLLLPKIWICILKVPRKLREISVLWALGSMVGATQMVDMVTSKNSHYGRVLVTVLDSKAIPEQLGVVIGDRWFEFPIEVDSIIHGVESYVEISNDPGGKDNNNDDENDDLLGDDDLMGGRNTTDRQHNASSGPKNNSDVDMDTRNNAEQPGNQTSGFQQKNLWHMRF